MFHRLFWDCHTSLSDAADEEVGVPGYFRFMTLLGGQLIGSGCCSSNADRMHALD